MMMKESRVKSVWSWNSPLSIGFDVIFGVIPAVGFGFISFILFIYSVKTPSPQNLQSFLLPLILGLGGSVASAELIFITFNRRAKIDKRITIFFLLFGIFFALYIFYISLRYLNSIFVVSSALISISIVAIKHILMLSRANSEVQP